MLHSPRIVAIEDFLPLLLPLLLQHSVLTFFAVCLVYEQ